MAFAIVHAAPLTSAICQNAPRAADSKSASLPLLLTWQTREFPHYPCISDAISDSRQLAAERQILSSTDNGADLAFFWRRSLVSLSWKDVDGGCVGKPDYPLRERLH